MWVKGELFDDLPSVAARFADRLSEDAQPHLFDRLTWFELTKIYARPEARPLIAYAHAQGHDAWIFLDRTAPRAAQGLSSWYTLAFRPVLSSDVPANVKYALLIAMARRLRKTLGTFSLEPVPDADGTKDMLIRAFRKAGWSVATAPKTGHWFTHVDGISFDVFWSRRPGQVRSTHDRRTKKFPMDLTVHSEVTSDLWAQYEAIFADSWKGDEGAPEFLRALAEHHSAKGSLRLGLASFGGRPIAAQLWTVDHGHAIIHKLAYREDAAPMSPGTLLSAAMFRHAIDTDKVQSISYGTGDDGYKRDWMDQREQLFILEFFNPFSVTGWVGMAKTAVSHAWNALKPRKKI
jgi:hypothetical protein